MTEKDRLYDEVLNESLDRVWRILDGTPGPSVLVPKADLLKVLNELNSLRDIIKRQVY